MIKNCDGLWRYKILNYPIFLEIRIEIRNDEILYTEQMNMVKKVRKAIKRIYNKWKSRLKINYCGKDNFIKSQCDKES